MTITKNIEMYFFKKIIIKSIPDTKCRLISSIFTIHGIVRAAVLATLSLS